MPESCNFDFWYYYIFLIMIFISITRTQVFTFTFRAFIDMYIFVYICCVRGFSCLAMMSKRCSFFLAFFSAGAVWLKYRSGFILMYILCALTLMVHLLEDVVCDWPILLLWPLSERDFALDWVNYTSYWVLGIMAAAACVLLYLAQPERKVGR